MGDHRASIKIEMRFHGKTETADLYINYSPEDDGCDERIKDWFKEKYEEGMDRYYQKMDEYRAKEAASKAKVDEAIAAKELAELDRLKLKYES